MSRIFTYLKTPNRNMKSNLHIVLPGLAAFLCIQRLTNACLTGSASLSLNAKINCDGLCSRLKPSTPPICLSPLLTIPSISPHHTITSNIVPTINALPRPRGLLQQPQLTAAGMTNCGLHPSLPSEVANMNFYGHLAGLQQSVYPSTALNLPPTAACATSPAGQSSVTLPNIILALLPPKQESKIRLPYPANLIPTTSDSIGNGFFTSGNNRLIEGGCSCIASETASQIFPISQSTSQLLPASQTASCGVISEPNSCYNLS